MINQTEPTSNRNLWGTLSHKQRTEYIVWMLVIIGGVTSFWASLVNGQLDLHTMFGNLSAELVGGAITFWVFQRLLDDREEDELKARLIRQMGNSDAGITTNAAKEMKARGWHKNGSLQIAPLWGTNLQGADLNEADLQHAIIWNADLQDIGLNKANLQRALFTNTNLQRARLKQANLQAAQLEQTDLQSADLSGANLKNASMYGANLHNAGLGEANLYGVHLDRANLSNAYLGNADLQGTHLAEANLVYANLSGTKFNEQTILPDGTSWVSKTDMTRFTDPKHPNFWRSDKKWSPAYHGKGEDVAE